MIPKQAIDLILNAEGIDQPSQWPGGESGITIGYGYDLGYETTFKSDWLGILNSGFIATLLSAIGKTGAEAQKIAPAFKGITIDAESALAVFLNKSLPHYESEAGLAFPGIEKLPDAARGALVSLVYNRGTDMTGPRRVEMRSIRQQIDDYANGKIELAICLKSIAQLLRLMKRLWIGQGLDGLLKRREAEAELVLSAIPSAQGAPS